MTRPFTPRVSIREVTAKFPHPPEGTVLPCASVADPRIFDLAVEGETIADARRRWRRARSTCSGCPSGTQRTCLDAAVTNELSGLFAGALLINGRASRSDAQLLSTSRAWPDDDTGTTEIPA